MDDPERFQHLLQQLQSLRREIERLEGEMDALVTEIADRNGKSKRDCLQQLLQAIVDEDSRQLPPRTE